MSSPSAPSPTAPPQAPASRLDSWKQIAAYFDRDVRTVQLWEKEEGLPIHRHLHKSRASVYAHPHELEAWLQRRRHSVDPAPPVAASVPQPLPAPTHTFRRLFVAAAFVFVLLAAALTALWRRAHKAPPAPSRTTIVLADFVNTTGEPVFDRTLNVALAAKLQQSPFLNLMPESRIRLALQYIGQPAQQRITQALARDICQREGGQAVLQGSIEDVATGYNVTLQAIDCRSARPIVTQQYLAPSQSDVLRVLDTAADVMRSSLGESLNSVHRYDVPLVEATTGSLDALSAFSQGIQAWNSQGESAALPFFQHAVAIDPNFALAYARLGTIYGNQGETQLANAAITRAYDLRARVTQWERFYITSHYFGFVTGQVDKEMQTYQDWSRIYPHDVVWMVNLSVDLGFYSQYQQAIELQQRALQEAPTLSTSYGDLAQFYLALDRPDEARAVLSKAHLAHVQDVNTQLADYGLAFYQDDAPRMAQLLADSTNLPYIQDSLLMQQAATDDRIGQLAQARALTLKAASLASGLGKSDTAAGWLAGEALRQAEMGLPDQARSLITQALHANHRSNNRDARILAALASAQAGQPDQARSLIDQLTRELPQDTLLQSFWVPLVRARIALAQGNPSLALSSLDANSPFDTGISSPTPCMESTLTRGEAQFAAHQPAAAAATFRTLLARHGLVSNCSTGILAQLGLARALAQTGDTAASRIAYQNLLALWTTSDPHLPLLQKAQAEYEALH